MESLVSEASIILTYKVKVNENATPGDNINTAQAISDFASSVAVTASVKVRTPSIINFLRISNTGVSSIIQPTAFNTNQDGGKNFEEIHNIPLLDGTSITLPTQQLIVASDQYTAGEPIVIEVIDLDQNLDTEKLDTIEVTVNIPGTNDTEILLLTETTPNSGVFRGIILTTTDTTKVQDGSLTIADGVKINVNYRDDEDNTDTSATAALVVPDTSLQIEKTVDKNYSAVGELVRYTLEFRNTTGYDLTNLQVNDLLPLGFRYIPNTAELNGNRLNNNVTFNGRELTFKINSMPAGSAWKIEYVTKISAGAKVGDAINTAYLMSDTLRSNDAQAIVKVKDDLMRDKNILTGRVYIGCKTKSDKDDDDEPPKVLGEARIFMETGRSVLTDSEGFWHMEGVYPGAHVLQLDTESIPGYETLLCNDNTRRARDARSHFVDLQAGNLWHIDFHVKPIEGYTGEVKTSASKRETTDPVKLFNKDYIDTATEGFDILWPKNNYVPAVASTKIYIKSSPHHKVDVFLNGKKVNPLNYDGSDTNKERTVTIKRWFGVDIDIKKKNNTLLAILKDKSGKEISRKTHNIHFSSSPASAELITDESVLIADGKTTPIIILKVKDEDGFPMRANTHGYFTIENNKYSVKTQNTNESDVRDLNESLSGTYKYEIEENGIARIELNPTTQSGQVKLNLQFTGSKSNTKNTEVTAWLKPALREWIMVGIAEGTLAHKRLSGNMRALKDLDKVEDFSKRGRVAFFAKGQVKGKYLLTIAYDTHKHDREVGSQLNGNINPDAYYTIYADNSNGQYDAPSSEKLYLKIEKDSFYALFGDYQTDMTITELAKYQRILNGIKTEYQGERISYKAFVSETSNNHHHEEIPGDGTSGLYYLNNDIIPNSETISIETRDRFRSDKIIEKRELRRYQDYNIDYSDGTLFFKFPITSRDRNFNPNIIVVDYDSEENSNKSITAGGRVALKSKDGKLETGVSFIHEGQNNSRDNQLVASDITYKITPDTEIHIEIAQSKTEMSEFEKQAAYIIELEKEIDNLKARLYVKKQETGFGIDSQGSENGIEKVGAELDYRINQNTRIISEVSAQKNLENDNKRRLAQIEVSHQIKQYEISAGYRHSQEEISGDNDIKEKIKSDTLLLGGQYTTKNDKVTLRTDLEKNISSKNGSEISPDRLIVGVDVNLTQGFSVFAEHETTDNGNIKTHNNRVGLSKNLWKGAKARTTYTQERTDEGQRNYATLGLSQNVKLSEKISADFTIDKAKTIGSNTTQKVFNDDEPVIQGADRDDYTAFSVGLGSNDEDWSWTSRAEYRDGDLYDKVNFLASIIRHYDNGKNLSAKLSYYNSEYEDGNFDRDIKLSFGSAWHPKEKDFVFFSRLDLVSEKSSSSVIDNVNAFAETNDNEAQKIIHNMHYNRKINEKTQLGIHHGIKFVKDDNNGVKNSSTIDTATIELRRDINKRWDIGLHGGYLRDWKDKATEYVAGISIGINPKKNIWVELGYNIEGFTDEDFDNNNYTSEGVYINFRYKFDQDTFKGDLHERLKIRN
ncbi:MAG: putative repeat protein (TIGR01451 family) [Cocleimonas sp.]